MNKRINEVVERPEDLRKVLAAIARGIDPSRIEEELQDLGLDVFLDTVDYGSAFGTITIEGGENENGCILTLDVVKIQTGFDTLNVKHGENN